MTDWRVIPDPDNSRRGVLEGPLFRAPCALGRAGVKPASDKREGDGATPLGVFEVRRVFYRPDREIEPVTALKKEPLSADWGWCDATDDPFYNRLVRLPYGPSHEKMWREDGLYDLVVVIGHNDDPVVPGMGSAIFLHVARPDYEPTEGCVALAAADLRRLLRLIKPGDRLKIG